MKKTKKFTVLSVGTLFALSIVSAAAANSGTVTVLVPRLGQMSESRGNIGKEQTSVPGTMYLNTAPHSFTLYGDYSEPNSSQNDNTRISDDYYALALRKNVKIYCGDITKGTRVGGRVGSSNFEIDERYVTFSYDPK